MKELKLLKKDYLKKVKETKNDMYTNNLNVLLEAKTPTDFLYRYNLIQESGMDTIDMPEIIFNSKFRGEFQLNTLFVSAVKTVLSKVC